MTYTFVLMAFFVPLILIPIQAYAQPDPNSNQTNSNQTIEEMFIEAKEKLAKEKPEKTGTVQSPASVGGCQSSPPLEDETIRQLEQGIAGNIRIQCLTNDIVIFAFTEGLEHIGWAAIDAFAKSNYTVSDVSTSGMGSQANPTRFFVIMSKD